MSSASRTVRVFLSSTFRDFAEERDLLVRKIFPELRRRCRERQVELVDVDLRWGITEEQAQRGKVLPICLAEIDRSRPYFMGFIGERYGWIPEKDMYDPSLLVEQSWLEEHRGGKSVTELEMLHGVLNNPAMKDRAFFYFRDPKYSDSKGGSYLSEGPQEKAKLEELKERIRTSGFPVMEDYADPEALAERVREDLWRMIDEAFPKAEVPDALTLERRRHEAYGASRRRLYLGGEHYFRALDEAMEADPYHPVLITGASGGGKSALIANWVAGWGERHPKTTVIIHHLGSGADAADPVKIAVRLIQEIARVTGDEFKPESDAEKQLEQLPQWLANGSAWAQRTGGEILLVLDGLDKVNDRKHLRWFPTFLPPGVKLVASCLDGEILEAAKGRLRWSELRVEPLTRAEQTRFITDYLGRYRKSLTPEQTARLQDHPLCGNPLFLLTILEELRVFGVHEELEKRLSTLLSSPEGKPAGEEPSVDDVFEHVLARVEEDLGEGMLRRSMEALWASRAGLFTDELLDIAKLAPSQWAAVQNALDESLFESGGRINFGHDYLRKAVEDRYRLTGEEKLALHRRLAEWFSGREIDARVAEELPWQWKEAFEKKRLNDCLLKQKIFERCCKKNEYELLSYWLYTEEDPSRMYQSEWEKWIINLTGYQLADLAASLADFLTTSGSFGEFSENLYRLSLNVREKVLGEYHADTLMCMNYLGVLLFQKGDFKKAKEILVMVLDRREKKFGSDDYETLVSVNNLGNLFKQEGEYKKAELYYRRALEGKEKVVGFDNPSTLISVYNLAGLYALKGDYPAAEKLYRRSLEGFKKALGAEHPRTLGTLNELATLFSDMADFSKAELLLQEALSGFEKTLGPNHPKTLACLNNLGRSLWEKGDYQKAENICRKVLAGRIKLLGNEHPMTYASLNVLGNILREKGDYEESEKFLRLALEGRKRTLGVDNLETLNSYNNLGNLLKCQGDYNSAENLFTLAIKGYEKILGPDHRDTLESIINLGRLFEERGDYVKSESLYRHALLGMSKVLGKYHPDALMIMCQLADLLHSKNNLNEAESLYREVIKGYEKQFGLEHEATISCFKNFADILFNQSRVGEAISFLTEKSSVSAKNEDALRYDLACYQCINGNIEKAKKLISEYLKIHPKSKLRILKNKHLLSIRDFIETL